MTRNGSIFDSLKTDVVKAFTRGGKVAGSVAITDAVLQRVVRKHAGKYYPKFFLKHPIGKALEPIVLNAAVLLAVYGLESYTDVKVPLGDKIIAACRYSMEGKARDLIALAQAPIMAALSQLGAELTKVEAKAA